MWGSSDPMFFRPFISRSRAMTRYFPRFASATRLEHRNTVCSSCGNMRDAGSHHMYRNTQDSTASHSRTVTQGRKRDVLRGS